MVTLQDISDRLMKPAKDLADWKFPLSKILEEYYALLEEPCDVNFGEAALVIQNSVNVYARRINCLFSEMGVHKNMFSTDEEKDATKTVRNEKKYSKKPYINCEDFALIDLEAEVGKNIDKRNQSQARKKVKLLSRRFTQLERTVTQLGNPLHVYDVSGEVIGKKYDFRCNQDINVNGMLVDKLTPDDFSRALQLRKERNPSLTSWDSKTPRTETSGYQSNTLPHIYTTSIDDVSDNERNPLDAFMESTRSTEDEENQAEANGDILELSDFNCSANCDSSVEEDASQKRSEDNSVEVNEKLKPEGESASVEEKGRSRTRMSIYSENNMNELELKLSPFKPRTRSVSSGKSNHLLPEYISLLTTKDKTVKPKRSNRIQKRVFRESELTKGGKKAIALKKSKFGRLRNKEEKDTMKRIDECVNAMRESSRCPYESVTDVAMDLLGFRLCPTNNNTITVSIIGKVPRSPSLMAVEPEREDSPELHEPSTSPSLSEDWIQAETSCTVPDYQTLIEDKMKKEFKESTESTELEHRVAKWHASLEPKLLEAEQRSAFRIYDYASNIIGTLQTTEQKTTNFEGIVQGKPACEVARYFLATLQLANTYNIEIKSEENNGGSIEIALLHSGGDCKNVETKDEK